MVRQHEVLRHLPHALRIDDDERAVLLQDDGTLGKLYPYTFDSEALKKPVRELVAAHGWELRETKFS